MHFREGILIKSQSFFESGLMYAVIESGGKQYRVSAGDTVQVERLPVEAGKTVHV
jgi:hypothetical protein